jgi:hypothetical protein
MRVQERANGYGAAARVRRTSSAKICSVPEGQRFVPPTLNIWKSCELKPPAIEFPATCVDQSIRRISPTAVGRPVHGISTVTGSENSETREPPVIRPLTRKRPRPAASTAPNCRIPVSSSPERANVSVRVGLAAQPNKFPQLAGSARAMRYVPCHVPETVSGAGWVGVEHAVSARQGRIART